MQLDFSSQDFSRKIKEIKRKHNITLFSGIAGSDEFVNLKSQFTSYISKNGINESKVLLIKSEQIKLMSGDISFLINQLFSSEVFVSYKQITINCNCEIINVGKVELPTNSDECRMVLEGLASDDYVVFYLSYTGLIPYFIDGKKYGSDRFTTDADLQRYYERKSVDDLETVIEDYRKTLMKRNVYQKFFEPKSHHVLVYSTIFNDKNKVTETDYLKRNSQVLINKPEDSFREDLRCYLSSNLRDVIVQKEIYLDNERRLDIAIFNGDGNEILFIEVKWVGSSIVAKGTEGRTTFRESDICPAAMNQTLDYIRELTMTKKHGNVRLGYLAVFDARDQNLPDTGLNMSPNMATLDNKCYFPYFKKIKDFRVINYIPR